MNTEKQPVKRFPYGINSVYGLGYWLKDYGHYPKGFPLFTYMDHGVTLFDNIHPHEINNDAPLIFKFSPRLVDIYKKHSNKPVYNLLNPAVHYRLSHDVKQLDNAKGTLFFAAHSTHDLDDETNWTGVIEKINALPEIYQPVDVCLHPVDVTKGLGEFFKSKGFKVQCAGDQFLDDFTENLYAILRNYKYVVSNLIGSYAFLSVEMGIPFSYYGNEPVFINKADKNFKLNAPINYGNQETYQKAKALFAGLHTSISKEQEYFVSWELGKYSTISRKKTCYLLYKAYFTYCLKHPGYLKYLKWLMKSLLSER